MTCNRRSKYTLEDIIREKEDVQKEICEHHEVLSEVSQRIFAPFLPSPHRKENLLIKRINTGMIILDGAMIGLKIFKSIRKVFDR